MKCKNCGFESEQAFDFCSACGAAVKQERTTANIAYKRILAALKDNQFLAICILMTLCSVLDIAKGDLSLLNILITVFLWLMYSNAKKDIIAVETMRCVSGTVYATYVILNVVGVIFAVVAVVYAVAFSYTLKDLETVSALRDALGESMGVDSSAAFDMLYSDAGWVFAGIFLFIAACVLVFNICGNRKIHRFAKTAYQSVAKNNFDMIENPNGTRKWLWVFAVCSIIVAFDSFLRGGEMRYIGMISSLCNAASYIIAESLIKKYINVDESMFTQYHADSSMFKNL